MTSALLRHRAAILRGALGLAVLAATGLALASLADEAESGTPTSRAALPVEVVSIEATDAYPVRELYAGRVVARRTSELGFERSGRLVEVAFDEGDRVEPGAVLAQLDTRELRARRRELEARRDRIRADLSLARATTERREELHDAGHLATQRLDETRYGQQALEAEAAAADASIEHVDVQLALSELRAPFAGILAERFADEGTVLAPGVPVLRLLEDGALEVHVGVSPDAANQLTPGSQHDVEVDGARISATLHGLLPTVDPDTRTVTAVLRLVDPPPAARHGALARVALERRVEAAGYWLPLQALAEGRRGLWTTYVAMPDGADFVAERRQVEVIHAEADRAYVRGTLVPGDRVVAAGVHRLVPGMRVRLVAAEG